MDTISTINLAIFSGIQPTAQPQIISTISRSLNKPQASSNKQSFSHVPINQESLPHAPINKEPLSHLSIEKRQQLQKAVDLILGDSPTGNASKPSCQPSMILLFGSYARGDWLETPNYQSSFDLLVVTKNALAAKKLECKKSLHKALKLEVDTPINLIAEDIQFVNRRIRKGQCFYTDMVRDGIVLYDSCEHQFAESAIFNLAERKRLAEVDFAHWFGKAMTLKKGFRLFLAESNYNEAVFLLHQIVERLYGAILLVFTRYRPSSHDLHKLGQRIASVEPQFLTVFPQGSEEDKTKFELLRQAYVNARYKPNFSISEDELMWLAERVNYLQNLTETLCQARIVSY